MPCWTPQTEVYKFALSFMTQGNFTSRKAPTIHNRERLQQELNLHSGVSLQNTKAEMILSHQNVSIVLKHDEGTPKQTE